MTLRRRLRHTRLWQALRPAVWELRRLSHPDGRAIMLNGICRMRVGPGVNLSHPTRPRYEPAYFRAFWKALRPGMTVFDIGANQGLFAIPAGLRVGHTGRIYAFEPAPAAQLVLQEQIRLNHLHRVVHPVASICGAERGIRALHVASSAVGWASAAEAAPGTQSLLLPVVTLDDFARRVSAAPDVIKIDAEGMEAEVLQGAAGLLSSARPPIVFCAVHPGCGEAIAELARRHRYAVHRPGGKPVSQLAPGEYILVPSGSTL